MIAETSRCYNGNHHSGLDMSRYSSSKTPDAEEVRQMRIEIRVACDAAMIDLAEGITREPVKLA